MVIQYDNKNINVTRFHDVALLHHSVWVAQQQLNTSGIAYTVRVYTAGIFIHSDVCDILYRYSITVGMCMSQFHYPYCMVVVGVSGL
jgi:hypothetical protein